MFAFLQEIALISKDARRTASIMCRERVEVLLVDRENIFEYCPDVFHREHQDKIQALRLATKGIITILIINN